MSHSTVTTQPPEWTPEIASPVAQQVELFAIAMNTAGCCGSDIGSGDCRHSATGLAGPACPVDVITYRLAAYR